MICDIHYRVLNQPRLCLRPQGYRWISIKFRRFLPCNVPKKFNTPSKPGSGWVLEKREEYEAVWYFAVFFLFTVLLHFLRHTYIDNRHFKPFLRSCSINSVVSASDGEVCKSRNPNATYVDTGAKTGGSAVEIKRTLLQIPNHQLSSTPLNLITI